MPSHKNSIHLPHPHVPHAYPLHLLEQQGAALALQTPSTDRFARRAKADVGSTHRRNSTCFSDAFVSDDFQMYDYKVRQCMRGRSHDWTVCPFAHPGEKARRRDPRKIHYSGEPCPDFRKGSCRKGDACEYAHGVFESWLHPARYRTQHCKDGKDCTRRVCFFAHSIQQLRSVGVPVKESREDGAPVKSKAHEVHSHIHDLGPPEGMCLLEDSFKWRVSMGDSYEHEVGLPPQTNSSALSSRDEYANVGSTFEAPLMSTSSYPNISSFPFKAISTVGFSSNNAMGVPLEVYPPLPMFSTIAPRPFVGSSMMGAIPSNDSSMHEQSSEPGTFSPASSLQLYTPVLGGISSSYGHTTSNDSPYMGGKEGGPICNASVDVSDMVYYGGYGDMAMQHRGRSRADANEVVNESDGPASKSVSLTDQLALLRKDMYVFSSYDSRGIYGLSSPTSTLTGPLHPTPFSSPPLSPLSIQSSETGNVFSIKGHGNGQVDVISPKADARFLNTHCGNELGIAHASTDQFSLHSHHHSQLVEYQALPQRLEMPSFSQCMAMENKWIPTCNSWNSEGTYKCDVAQLTNDMQKKSCDRFGDDSPAENVMPDLEWVHELVK